MTSRIATTRKKRRMNALEQWKQVLEWIKIPYNSACILQDQCLATIIEEVIKYNHTEIYPEMVLFLKQTLYVTEDRANSDEYEYYQKVLTQFPQDIVSNNIETQPILPKTHKKKKSHPHPSTEKNKLTKLTKRIDQLLDVLLMFKLSDNWKLYNKLLRQLRQLNNLEPNTLLVNTSLTDKLKKLIRYLENKKLQLIKDYRHWADQWSKDYWSKDHINNQELHCILIIDYIHRQLYMYQADNWISKVSNQISQHLRQ